MARGSGQDAGLSGGSGRRISSPMNQRVAITAEAIRRVAETETDLATFLKKGADGIARGDVVPHEQVMAELDSMIDKHRARCRE